MSDVEIAVWYGGWPWEEATGSGLRRRYGADVLARSAMKKGVGRIGV